MWKTYRNLKSDDDSPNWNYAARQYVAATVQFQTTKLLSSGNYAPAALP